MATYESCEGMNLNELTLFAEDSHASRTPSQESERLPTMTATSGLKCSESFAQLSPDGSWLKMCQGYLAQKLDGSLEEFSETWPRAGILSGGIAYQRQPLVLRIAENECSLSENWSTPNTMDALPQRSGEALIRQATTTRAGRTRPANLREQVNPEVMSAWNRAQRMWPTPAAQDGKNATLPPSQETRDTLPRALIRESVNWPTPRAFCHKDSTADRNKSNLGEKVGGQLNPDWVECLMGFPAGYTRLSEDATGPPAQGESSTNGSRRE